jgi:hypothetical protein
VEDELPPGGGGVDLLRDALKANLPVVQLCDALNEVFEGAAEAIQFPDNQGVARPNVRNRFCQAFALGPCAGGGIGEDFGAACLSPSYSSWLTALFFVLYRERHACTSACAGWTAFRPHL